MIVQKTVSAAFIIMLVLAVSCLTASAADDYYIGAQDVLKITVYEHPDLATETRVSEDGKISMPLIGEIKTTGLSQRALEKLIARKLSSGKFIKNPQVTVLIVQYRGQRVTVMGEVNKPGQYEMLGPTTVLDIISNAAGLTQLAGYSVIIFRKEIGADGEESTRKIDVDLDLLLNHGDLSQNIILQNRDVVNIPKTVFYIYGEVQRPGAYRLEKGLTVKRAISIGGGLTPKGSQRRIEITRKENGRETELSGDVDDTVNADDVIRVKESIF